MAKYDIVTRAERRRKFTDEQQSEIVNEALGPDGVIAEVARKYELSQSLLHRWIRENRDRAEFAVLKVGEGTSDPTAGLWSENVVKTIGAIGLIMVTASGARACSIPGGKRLPSFNQSPETLNFADRQPDFAEGTPALSGP
ncbi:MAG TPA: transposase [Oligoflexus sp.]|uniref:transposase n=1 Tax=Oligoflexus sp. TaxID=1971216 RepID=UPI002D25C046|nr:transposase [Oligoflexus sp.]HYX37886.1 transposase [Oligoflexus sp.]